MTIPESPRSELAELALAAVRAGRYSYAPIVAEAHRVDRLNEGCFALGMARAELLGMLDGRPSDPETVGALGLIAAASGTYWTAEAEAARTRLRQQAAYR